MNENAYVPQDAESANNMVESSRKAQERIDRLNEEEASKKVEQQEIELQQQEVQVMQQEQNTQHLLVVGGLGIGVLLAIVVTVFLLAKAFRGNNK